ncbi:MAG: threonine aldolase [Telmatospirillum sp.]|nr:threonine aldolase [Telmatospirillum sp.]
MSPAEEFRQIADWCDANHVARDFYGEGELIAGLERKVAGLLGKQAAVFMPTGKMAQAVALRIWTERAGVDRVGLHPTAHPVIHEAESYQALFNIHGVIVGHRLRPLTAADLDAQAQPMACLMVELPLREAGGLLPAWEDLVALRDHAAARALPLHMDGARLWESLPFYERDAATVAGLFQSVYVSLYKGIGGIAGAILAGDADFVAEARLWQKRLGGVVVQLSPMIASIALRFDHRLAMMDALHRRAVDLARSLSRVPGIRIAPEVPATNMMHVYLDAPPERLQSARDAIARAHGVWVVPDARPAEVPGWSLVELTVGDTILELPDADVVVWWRRLLEEARS